MSSKLTRFDFKEALATAKAIGGGERVSPEIYAKFVKGDEKAHGTPKPILEINEKNSRVFLCGEAYAYAKDSKAPSAKALVDAIGNGITAAKSNGKVPKAEAKGSSLGNANRKTLLEILRAKPGEVIVPAKEFKANYAPLMRTGPDGRMIGGVVPELAKEIKKSDPELYKAAEAHMEAFTKQRERSEKAGKAKAAVTTHPSRSRSR
jgi:hypothetical protein